MVVLDVFDPSSLDPLLEASRAAARTLLRGLGDEFGEEEIRADLLRVDRSRVDPERCAEAVCEIMSEQPGPTGYSVHDLPPP